MAALFDIHGNLPALEAVLDEVRRAGVDRIVVGGDVCPGPMPRQTLACLLSLDIPTDFIYGNGEVAVLDETAGREPRVPPQYRDTIRWNALQLDPGQRLAVASWPLTVRLHVPPIGEVLFCHATPQNENDIFVVATPDAALAPIFGGVTAQLVVCGHTHIQFDRVVGRVRVVNAGSVGMPFGDAGADWLLLGEDVQLRHTTYDLAAAAERVLHTSYPGAGEFARKYILHPPSAEEMLAIYRPYEIKAART